MRLNHDHGSKQKERCAQIRAAFIAGESIREICDRFDAKPHNVRVMLGAHGLYFSDQHKVRSALKAARVAETLSNLPLSISRDPCFACGTRGDIGCAHQVQ